MPRGCVGLGSRAREEPHIGTSTWPSAPDVKPIYTYVGSGSTFNVTAFITSTYSYPEA